MKEILESIDKEDFARGTLVSVVAVGTGVVEGGEILTRGINVSDGVLGMSGVLRESDIAGVSGGGVGVAEFCGSTTLVTAEANGDIALGAVGLGSGVVN